jgi:murein DD-endopeptidase MepM/ murein hydrolase activator NlpD
LLVVPDGGGVRRFRITGAYLVGVAAALLVSFFGGLLGLAALWSEGPLASLPGFGLRRENNLLRERVQALDGDLTQLRLQLGENARLEAQMRLLANLPPIDPEVRKMGVGGPDFSVQDPLLALAPDAATLVRGVAGKSDQLLRQAEFQRHSYQEIVGSLEANREKWARIPSVLPVHSGELTSGFGGRPDPFTEEDSFHHGLDVSAPLGTPIRATAAGRVVFSRASAGYGLTVVIEHRSGLATRYAHVGQLLVTEGERVKRGQYIAYVGSTGRSTAPHVHYEVWVDGEPVNPMAYILPAGEIVD